MTLAALTTMMSTPGLNAVAALSNALVALDVVSVLVVLGLLMFDLL